MLHLPVIPPMEVSFDFSETDGMALWVFDAEDNRLDKTGLAHLHRVVVLEARVENEPDLTVVTGWHFAAGWTPMLTQITFLRQALQASEIVIQEVTATDIRKYRLGGRAFMFVSLLASTRVSDLEGKTADEALAYMERQVQIRRVAQRRPRSTAAQAAKLRKKVVKEYERILRETPNHRSPSQAVGKELGFSTAHVKRLLKQAEDLDGADLGDRRKRAVDAARAGRERRGRAGESK